MAIDGGRADATQGPALTKSRDFPQCDLAGVHDLKTFSQAGRNGPHPGCSVGSARLLSERIRSMRQLLRQGIETMPAPLPVWMRGGVPLPAIPSSPQASSDPSAQFLGRLDRPRQVSQGPFQGMGHRRPGLLQRGPYPKLVGTYECELIPAIEAICRSGCDRIVDIGAAEGYYAVADGACATRWPVSCSFEMSPSARYYLRRLARRNGVSDRIAIQGECFVDSLRAFAGGRPPPRGDLRSARGAEDSVALPLTGSSPCGAH